MRRKFELDAILHLERTRMMAQIPMYPKKVDTAIVSQTPRTRPVWRGICGSKRKSFGTAKRFRSRSFWTPCSTRLCSGPQKQAKVQITARGQASKENLKAGVFRRREKSEGRGQSSIREAGCRAAWICSHSINAQTESSNYLLYIGSPRSTARSYLPCQGVQGARTPS